MGTRVSPEIALSALLYALATGHPDAALIKQYADSAKVPPVLAWALVATESGHGANNHARGKHGEVGRMQLRRFHAGRFSARCGSLPLTDYRTNLCVGLHLLRSHYEAAGSWPLAVRRYNGSGVATLTYLGKVEREVGAITMRLMNGGNEP